MKKTYIAMSSITFAMRAKDVLSRSGIRCEIVRTPKNLGTGCGYSIAVTGDVSRALRLLDNNSIPHKMTYES